MNNDDFFDQAFIACYLKNKSVDGINNTEAKVMRGAWEEAGRLTDFREMQAIKIMEESARRNNKVDWSTREDSKRNGKREI